MNKHFIFGGCSFVAMPNSWARQLTQKINPNRCDVSAHAGAGNTMIAHSVLHQAFVQQINKLTPDITIMWSHPSRYDFPLNPTETPYYNHLFYSNNNEGTHFNPAYYDENNYWLLGCGNGHIDFTRASTRSFNQTYVQAFRSHHQMVWNKTHQWMNTLQAILLIQSVCEANNWPYRFAVYNNYMKDYVDESNAMLAVYKMIKWDKFTFVDDEYGGLREYTLANLNTWDDGYDMHPSYEAHTEFLENFWLPIHIHEYNPKMQL